MPRMNLAPIPESVMREVAEEIVATEMDTDDLPAAQYLILEVLAARYRTGERAWTFPARLRRQVDALADTGLIGWKSGVAPKTVIAWLTDAGRKASMSESYVPPNERQGAQP